MPIHVVGLGECMLQIAQKHGFADWRRIWNDPNNAELRARRPNPDVLHPGDRIVLPDRERKAESVRANKRHFFRLKRQQRQLRLVVEDAEGQVLSNEPYTLIVDGIRLSSKNARTSSDGSLTEAIPIDAAAAVLLAGEHKWHLELGGLNPVREECPDGGVSGAQARLANLGIAALAVTGEMNELTRLALRKVQGSSGLPSTGELDAATRTKLEQLHGR